MTLLAKVPVVTLNSSVTTGFFMGVGPQTI